MPSPKRSREALDWDVMDTMVYQSKEKRDVILVRFVHDQYMGEPLQFSFFIDPRKLGDGVSLVDPFPNLYLDPFDFQKALLCNNPWLPEVIDKLWPDHVRRDISSDPDWLKSYEEPPRIIKSPDKEEEHNEEEEDELPYATLLKFLELAYVEIDPPVCISSVWKFKD